VSDRALSVRRRYDGPSVPARATRLAVPDSETPARSKIAVDRLIARREVHLREKTLWRMLYETAGRAEEIPGVNIEDLDFAGRRCPVKAKGARSKARRRGQAREDFVLETVYWDAGTARLLPRLLRGRTRGPVFVTHRRPGPGKVVSPRGVCPDTGLAGSPTVRPEPCQTVDPAALTGYTCPKNRSTPLAAMARRYVRRCA